MSIASEITRLQNAKASLKSSINAKTDAQHQITDETIDDYSSFVDSISSGSGDIADYFKLTGSTYDNPINKYIKQIPQIDTSNVTAMDKMFQNCELLETIPLLNTSKVTRMEYMFNSCSNLTSVPLLDTNKVTNMNAMFSGCEKLVSIPQLNTSNVTAMFSMFNYCLALTTVPLLDCSKVISLNMIFSDCGNLTTLGGLQNLGQAYSTTTSANYNNYKLDLSSCTKLTEQSIINVLTNLYDIATKGCNTQSVVLGETNLAKLTSEAGQAALTQAQNYGWTVS